MRQNPKAGRTKDVPVWKESGTYFKRHGNKQTDRKEKLLMKMKTNVELGNLLRGISTATKAVATKATMPILECLLLEATPATLRFVGNNTEMAIRADVPAITEMEGKVAVPAKLFGEMCRKLPDKTVTLEVDDSFVVTIKCGRVKFDIAGIAPDDFASIPEVARDTAIKVNYGTLKSLINKSAFCADITADKNPMMASELLTVKDGKLRMVALDGKRVAIVDTDLDSEAEVSAIVPVKAANEIARIPFADDDADVSLFVTSNHLLVETDDIMLVTRLMSGEYFRYEAFLAGDYKTKVVADRKELCAIIDRALLFHDDKGKPVILDIKDGKVAVSITSVTGSLDDETEVDKSGEDLRIGFNPKLLIDVLKAVDEDELTITMSGKKNPAFVKGEGYTYLALPVNFTE